MFCFNVVSGSNAPPFNVFFFVTEPSDVIGYKGKSLRLPCKVGHEQGGQLEISWLKDGQLIDHSADPR